MMIDKQFVGDAKDTVCSLADTVFTKVKGFDMFDFAILKICLGTIGMLIGMCFSKSLKKAAPFLVLVAIVSYAYIMYKVFFEYCFDGDEIDF